VEQPIFIVCALASWVAAIYRVPGLMRKWDPARFTLFVILALVALTFTLSTPSVSAAVDRRLGVANLAALSIHVTAVVVSFAAQIHVDLWQKPPEVARRHIRWRLLVLAGVVVLLVVLFPKTPERRAHFLVEGAQSGGSPNYFIYLAFYLGALVAGYTTSAVMCWRYAGVCGRPWLRRGLRVVAVGLALTVAYCAARALTVAVALLGGDPYRWTPLVPLFSGGGFLVTLIGLAIPALGPRMDATREWVDAYRSYRRLEPLWQAYYGLDPGIALEQPVSRGRELVEVRRLRHRLMRRMIEMWDGRLVIASHIDGTVAETARAVGSESLSEDELRVVTEAAQIRLALRALEVERGDGAPAASAPSGTYARPPAHADVLDERQWLENVSEAFAKSAIVARIATEHLNYSPVVSRSRDGSQKD
jgi:hypothetical protein